MAYAEVTGPLDWSDSVINLSTINLSHIKCRDTTNFLLAEFRGETTLRGATFVGDANFKGSTFGDSAHFKNTTFESTASFTDAMFKNDLHFGGAELGGDADFTGTTFEASVHFRSAIVKGDALCRSATVKGFAEFGSATFRGFAEFDAASFEYTAEFGDATFESGAGFRSTAFEGDIDFTDARFEDGVYFTHSKFRGNSYFRDVTFEGDAELRSAKFGGSAVFKNTTFESAIDFSKVEFDGDPFFDDLTLDGAQFKKADLTDATFAETSLCAGNLESALLSRATLFGADLRGAKLNGAVLGDVRIDDDTKFLGHPTDDSDSSPHTLSAIRSRPTCVYDPDYEEESEHADVDKAKSVYRALEELGGKHARPRLQARSFVRRQDLQKQAYWDDATADDASLEERFIAGARWSRAKVARATLLYGESPWRVVGTTAIIIALCGLLYPLFGIQTDGQVITYSTNTVFETLADSFYFSIVTFTTLGYGDVQPAGLARLVAVLETIAGSALLALLVFVFGRRATR